MAGDGKVGVCEHCTESHTKFFAHRRAERR
jgi:copper oxidase (laccase) domain-containing protein